MPKLKYKKQSRFTKLAQLKRLYAIVFVLLFAGIASYLVFQGSAANCKDLSIYSFGCTTTEYVTVKNPALHNACTTKEGFDIALLVDTSGSMSGEPLNNAKAAMRTFIKELSGTNNYFAIGTISYPKGITLWTKNQAKALSNVDTIIDDGDGTSYLDDLRVVTSGANNDWRFYNYDPRPDVQDWFIILTDGQIKLHWEGARVVQENGTRLLAIGFGDVNKKVLMDIAGPRVDTGSIWTSDVITTAGYNFNTSDSEALVPIFKTIATQCKNGPGNGNGNGGTGTGTNGQGQGEGPSSGAGGGGGGSSANKQQEKPNTVPKAASQGETVEPPKPEPSPFFDGKEYERGSDRDTVAGTVTETGKKLVRSWPTILAVVVLGGSIGFGYWKWRQSRKA